VSFLTLARRTAALHRDKVLFVSVALLLLSQNAFGQGGLDGGIALQARSAGASAQATSTGGALPWMIGLVCLVLIGILVVTLWPNASDANPYQRQRKFARIDGLFLKISALMLGMDDSRRFLTHLRSNGEYEPTPPAQAEGLTLMSLSFGGCSIASPTGLTKGNVVLLHLHSLPDFPSQALTVAAKIVWTRPRTAGGEPYDVAGAKFLFPSDATGIESLRQYLNFLMDEPLT